METVVNVHYHFFHDYILNNDFITMMKKRKSDIRNRFVDKESEIYNSYDKFIREYFVEIFSWSVLPYDTLYLIEYFILLHKLDGIIDPCCGNAFHAFLFNKLCGLEVHCSDIQAEPNSWVPVTEIEGTLFLKNLDTQQHMKKALILSWIDYESLTIDLLDLYKGKMVISIGNYDKLSPNYILKLKKNYKLIESIILVMPWGLKEKIEIYIR